jgi:hypothetical protein
MACGQLEKHAFKSAEQGFKFKPLLEASKAKDRYVRCLAHLIDLLAQAVLLNLKSLAEKHTSVLHISVTPLVCDQGRALYGR